jgi:predicted nucleic acid-binding protein
MHVFADSSFLIHAARLGAFAVLQERFGTVLITQLVKDEVMARPELPGASDLAAAMRAGWIRVTPTPLTTWQHADLDPGEASLLAAAAERGAALVLIDDVLGRERALTLGLQVLGVRDVLDAGS